MSTLRMLRRRHCRCNLLLLLAVCAVSAVALLKWGFMDAVKRSTIIDEHSGMTDMHGSDGSHVSGEHDGGVENFAPPLHGAPPEDKEEEEEEEKAKRQHSHEKHAKVTTTRTPPPPPPPKSQNKPPVKPVESEEIKSKEDEVEAPEMSDVANPKPADSEEKIAVPAVENPQNPQPGIEEPQEISSKDTDALKEPEIPSEASSHDTELNVAADEDTDEDKPQINQDKPAPEVPGHVPGDTAAGLPAREAVGSNRIPSTLLEVLDAAQTTASMPKVAHAESGSEQKQAAPAPVHTLPPPRPTRPRVEPTIARHVMPTTTTRPPYVQTRRLPEVLLIGAVSCPVDVVVSFLHLHPDIVLGGVVNFFNDDVNYKRGLSWYANQMPLSYPDQVTIDVNPTYYLAGQTPERIYHMSPNTKLLFVVCDPIMRALAHHVNASQEKEFDALAFHSSKDGKVNERYEAIQYSLYFYHMQRWLKIFPKKQLLVIDVGTLRKNLHAELSNIENFLDIQHNILNVPANLDPSVMKKLQKFFQAHNEDFFKAIGRRFEWQ